jgi:hypothetical protein
LQAVPPHTPKMNHLRIVAACLLAALLAACGGGGSPSPPSPDIGKYMGTWIACHVPEAGRSLGASWTLAPLSGATASLVESSTVYESNESCSGTPSLTSTGKGTVTFVGTTQIGADVADKYDYQAQLGSPATGKGIYVIRPDGKLYGGINHGLPGASFDAQGYPSAINTDLWVFRRP